MRVLGIDPGLSKGKDGGGLCLLEPKGTCRPCGKTGVIEDPPGRHAVCGTLLSAGPLLEPMPLLPEGGGLDEQKVCELVRAWAPDLVAIEALALYAGGRKAGAKGLAGQLRGAAAWGFLRGVVVDQGRRLIEVPPQTWQRWAWGIGATLPGWYKPADRGDTKICAARVAAHLFPGVDFRATARSRCVHTGLIDAALIAAWARSAKA